MEEKASKKTIYRGIDPKPEIGTALRTVQFYGLDTKRLVKVVEREDPTHPFNQHQLDYPNEHELTGNREKRGKGLRSDYGWDDCK